MTDQEAAEIYAESLDNEGGNFFRDQIEAIRARAFLAGCRHVRETCVVLTREEIGILNRAIRYSGKAEDYMIQQEAFKILTSAMKGE
jgi:flagellar basal body rod protein FlgF